VRSEASLTSRAPNAIQRDPRKLGLVAEKNRCYPQRKPEGLAGGSAEVASITHGERLREIFAGHPSLAPPSPAPSPGAFGS
jgi:hypothetical protein